MHFPVTVITKDGDYDSALAPFSQHLLVDWYVIRTKSELITEKRREYEWAKKSNQKKLLNYLESNYDFSDDDNLITSIIRTDTDECTRFDEDGNELSQWNPSGKWDWYQLGGRYSGMLHLARYTVKKGETIFFHSVETTDSAKVKDIDWNSYKLSPELNEQHRKEWNDNLKSDYGTVDNYLKICNSFFTWNLLYDSVWYRPDDSDLFCMDMDKNLEYQRTFFEIMDHLSPDNYVSIIDCHY